MELTITNMALAQLPGAASRQIQPALTLALALTSLVLLLFYIYLRKDGFNRSNKSPKKADGIQKTPLETRLIAADEALCHLFDCHTIPMAKSTLEQGQIIDVNPCFCKLLGYPKKDLLGKTWVELDMIPVGKDSNHDLAKHGWVESIAPRTQSGQMLDLRILSLIVDSKSDQSMEKENLQVLTIVSESPKQLTLCGD